MFFLVMGQADEASPPDAQALLGHTAWLRGLVRRLVADADVDDVVQEAMGAAVGRAPAEPVGARRWLATVVRRLAANRRLRAARLRRREQARARMEAVPSTDEVVQRAERQRLVVEAVLGLGEPYRSTLLLRFWEDLGVGAIAKSQGVKRETVKSRVSRGLALLRSALDDRHRGDRESWCASLATLLPEAPAVHPGAPRWWDGWAALLVRVLVVALACLAIASLGSWMFENLLSY